MEIYRGVVHSYDIWHGDAKYPSMFCTGMQNFGGDEFPETPGFVTASVLIFSNASK